MVKKKIHQRGLYFEEFEVGATYVHAPSRTVTETDNLLFSTITMNPQSLHLDAEWSKSTEFGERLVNSMFTLSLLVGLSVGQLTQATIVANLGFSDISFPHPVRIGDTLTATTKVLGARASKSRPRQGIVKLEHVAKNQHGQVVAVAVRSTLMQGIPKEDS